MADKYISFREPGFLIIGSQKSGTSMLFHYLCRHPEIGPPVRKEVHYFDDNYHRGIEWYRSHFPPVKMFPRLISGEASPYYIFHPLAPQRVFETFPKMKLIVILKNPVDRAYSHYQHNRREQRETRSFEEALAGESLLLEGEKEKMCRLDNYFSENHKHFSYRARGVYIRQFEHWSQRFPIQQFKIIDSRDLFESPIETMKDFFEFLEREPFTIKESKKRNHMDYPPMKPETRRKLRDFFAPYNRELFRFLQRDFPWEI